MSNPSQRKPGEDELGFSRLKRLHSDNPSKRSSKEGTTIDPLKRKSKELEASADRSEFKENVDSHSKRRKLESRESSNEDIQERLSANRTRFDKLRNELGSTTDRLRPQEFEDIQNRLSANQARLDNIKKADRGYSDEFHKNVGILFKLGREAKSSLKYINEHSKLPPPLKGIEK